MGKGRKLGGVYRRLAWAPKFSEVSGVRSGRGDVRHHTATTAPMFRPSLRLLYPRGVSANTTVNVLGVERTAAAAKLHSTSLPPPSNDDASTVTGSDELSTGAAAADTVPVNISEATGTNLGRSYLYGASMFAPRRWHAPATRVSAQSPPRPSVCWRNRSLPTRT